MRYARASKTPPHSRRPSPPHHAERSRPRRLDVLRLQVYASPTNAWNLRAQGLPLRRRRSNHVTAHLFQSGVVMLRKLLPVLTLLVCAAIALADKITLKDGTVLD